MIRLQQFHLAYLADKGIGMNTPPPISIPHTDTLADFKQTYTHCRVMYIHTVLYTVDKLLNARLHMLLYTRMKTFTRSHTHRKCGGCVNMPKFTFHENTCRLIKSRKFDNHRALQSYNIHLK